MEEPEPALIRAAAAGDTAAFERLVRAFQEPVWRFLNETPDRVPMTDCYHTDSGTVAGFRARPVVGAVFMPLLHDRDVWKKWSSRSSRSQGTKKGS